MFVGAHHRCQKRVTDPLELKLQSCSYPQQVLVSELSSSGVEVLLTSTHYFSSSQRIILTKGVEAVTQNSKYLKECFNSSLHSDELIRKSNKIYVKTKSLTQDTNDKVQPGH